MDKYKKYILISSITFLLILLIGIILITLFNVGITEKFKLASNEAKTTCELNEEFLDKEACYDRKLNILANNEQDISYCDLIKTEIIKKECKLQIINRKVRVNENVSFCDELDDSQTCKDNYYIDKSWEEDNIDILENVQDEDRREQAEDSMNFDEAMNSGDCSILETPEAIEHCEMESS